jgi:hypothetical protein
MTYIRETVAIATEDDQLILVVDGKAQCLPSRYGQSKTPIWTRCSIRCVILKFASG